jgi:hypothetical protein
MDKEVWTLVQGYDYPYEVSNFGRVLGTKGILKPYDNGYGYLVVELRQNGKKKHLRVHRLVASAFVENPNGFPEVNHKDENKRNNKSSNLEWCTSSYNKKYGSGRKSRSEGMKRVWEERRADNG